MTVALGGNRLSLPAAADLSTNVNGGQFLFVSQDVNGRGTVAAPGSAIVGIGQNKPLAQDAGYGVQYDGVSKLRLFASVNVGERLAPAADGSGTATTVAGYNIGAIALEAGASGAYIAVQVTPGNLGA